MPLVHIEFERNFFAWSKYQVPQAGFTVDAENLGQAIKEISAKYDLHLVENIEHGKYWTVGSKDEDIDGSLVDIHIVAENGKWTCPKHDRNASIPVGHKLRLGRLVC